MFPKLDSKVVMDDFMSHHKASLRISYMELYYAIILETEFFNQMRIWMT